MNRSLLLLSFLLALAGCSDSTGSSGEEAGPAAAAPPAAAGAAEIAPAPPDPAPAPAQAAKPPEDGGGRRGGRGSRSQEPAPVITRDTARSRSRIDFSVTRVDLGQMYQEERRELAYPFQLAGPDPVVLVDLEVSCGCTEPSLEVEGEPWQFGQPIPAGSSGRVLAIFDSKRYELDKSSSIRVHGNAVNLPVQLSIQAHILPLFRIDPRMARFDNLLTRDLRRNENPTRKLEVTGAQPFEILEWTNKPDWVVIEEVGEPRTAADGRGQIRTLEVGLQADVPEGRHSAVAEGTTSLGKTIPVQVYAEVFGAVRYFPDTIQRFGLQAQGSTEMRVMRIQATQDRLEIPAPSYDYSGPADVFEITLDEKKPGLRYDLSVRLLPEAPIGRHEGKIKLSWPASEGIPSGIPDQEFGLSVIVTQPR